MEDQPYDRGYWDNYRKLDRTPSGEALTHMRMALVEQFFSGVVCDVGIGGGRFVAERPYTRGFDINPHAVAWLKQAHLWMDPYVQRVHVMTFWDAFEHIHDPLPLIANATDYVFMSLPIFDGPDHVLRSKHFKKEEHCWYFTVEGLVGFMSKAGFNLLHQDRREEDAGREGIGSFAFGRREVFK